MDIKVVDIKILEALEELEHTLKSIEDRELELTLRKKKSRELQTELAELLKLRNMMREMSSDKNEVR